MTELIKTDNKVGEGVLATSGKWCRCITRLAVR